MTRAGRAGATGVALLVLALVGACSTLALPAAPPTPAPVHPVWPGCAALGAFADPGVGPVDVGGVPSGFSATTVVLCEESERQDARGDTIEVGLERTSTGVGPLLTYLAQPSERPSDGACTADAWLAPWLFLVDGGGRYVAPAIPVDGCGKPLGWYEDRDRLAWQTIAYTDRVVLEGEVRETAEARRAGCAMGWKDMVDAYATSSHVRPGRLPRDPFAGRRLKSCVYAVPTADRGTDTPAGEFVRGSDLADEQRRALVSLLLAAPEVSQPCTTPNVRFATVAPADGGPSLYVELDGCRRVVSDADPTTVVRAGDELVALLGG